MYLKNYLKTNKEIFIQCKTCAFIPIFVNINEKHEEINVEHSHPPKQLFWHGFHIKEKQKHSKIDG